MYFRNQMNTHHTTDTYMYVGPKAKPKYRPIIQVDLALKPAHI